MSALKIIQSCLQKLINCEEFRSINGDQGLCWAIYEYATGRSVPVVAETHRIMCAACEGWGHYSGDESYPISHPVFGPETGFTCAVDEHDMYEGEYGRRRLELAQRMLDVIEKELAE